MQPHQLELLAPARNLDIGLEAINHGADAVYIGGPSFGARSTADNSVQDIAKLVQYAHRFHSRIFVTLNTILRDDELEGARQLAWQLYDAGVDALIVQDMGLLEIELGVGGQAHTGAAETDAEVDRILTSPQGAQIASMMKHTAVGTPSQVREQLLEFTAYADADELMVCHQSPTIEGRLRSIQLTAEAMDLVAV